MPTRAIRVCLITNPRGGQGRLDIGPALAVLRAHGWQPDVREKEYGGHATELAWLAARAGYDVVVGCAGDGTLNEIANGLAGTAVPLGVLPAGTVNLWSRELGVSPRLERAAAQLVEAQRRRIDLGQLIVAGTHTRYFLLMAGLGVDGAVMGRVSKPLKRRIGRAAVGLAIAQSLPALRSVRITAELDGHRWRGRVSELIVGNTRLYGGFTSVTPDAYVDDGLLDTVLITAADPLAAGRQLASLLIRRHPDSSSARTYRVAALSVRSARPLPVQIDGGVLDLKELRPGGEGILYEFSTLAQGLTVLVPADYHGKLFLREALVGQIVPADRRDGGPMPEGDPDAEKDALKGVLRVVSVADDAILAARLRSGRIWTLQLTSKTALQDAEGQERSLHTSPGAIRPGAVVRVKGKKDRDAHTIAAKRVTLLQGA